VQGSDVIQLVCLNDRSRFKQLIAAATSACLTATSWPDMQAEQSYSFTRVCCNSLPLHAITIRSRPEWSESKAANFLVMSSRSDTQDPATILCAPTLQMPLTSAPALAALLGTPPSPATGSKLLGKHHSAYSGASATKQLHLTNRHWPAQIESCPVQINTATIPPTATICPSAHQAG
jgi:hypothetical protein